MQCIIICLKLFAYILICLGSFGFLSSTAEIICLLSSFEIIFKFVNLEIEDDVDMFGDGGDRKGPGATHGQIS